MKRLFMAALLICATVQSTQAQKPPNILFILTDDQGWWELGAHGNQWIDTPVLDSLYRQSVSFSRYYAAPVCSPTRAGLITGRYHLRTGLYNTRFGGDVIAREEITIAQLLKESGYRTGLFGKWHLGKYYGYQPHQKGFDEFLGHYAGHIDEYDYPDQIVHNGEPVEARSYVTDLFTDAAIEFIDYPDDRPFFCYLSYNAPHSPWVVGTSHDRQTRGFELVKKYLDKGLTVRDAHIYAMVEIIDQNVGRLLGYLTEKGLDKNTVVIFSCDNGGISNFYTAGLRGKKGSVYEGGIRAPLIVRWPGNFPENKQVDAMISHIDLVPTLCELTGTPLPADRVIDGKSFLPLLKQGQGKSPHTYLFHHWDRYFPNPYNMWAVTDGRYKLLNSPRAPWPTEPVVQPEPFGELYDLMSDPGEAKNIASQHPDIVRRLRTAFLDYFADVTKNKVYEPVPIPVGYPQENPVEIQPSWARLSGKHIRYTFRGYDWDSIDSWKDMGEYVEWQLEVAGEGNYEVMLRYGCTTGRSPGKLRISVGNNILEHIPEATPTADVFKTRSLGTIRLEKGILPLRAQIVQGHGNELMTLNKIWLKKVD